MLYGTHAQTLATLGEPALERLLVDDETIQQIATIDIDCLLDTQDTEALPMSCSKRITSTSMRAASNATLSPQTISARGVAACSTRRMS